MRWGCNYRLLVSTWSSIPFAQYGHDKSNPLERTTRDHALLRSIVDALNAARDRRKRVIRDRLEQVCTGYSRFIGTHAELYCTQVNAERPDSQIRGVLAGVSHISIGEETFSVRIDEEPGDEEYGDHLTSQ